MLTSESGRSCEIGVVTPRIILPRRIECRRLPGIRVEPAPALDGLLRARAMAITSRAARGYVGAAPFCQAGRAGTHYVDAAPASWRSPEVACISATEGHAPAHSCGRWHGVRRGGPVHPIPPRCGRPPARPACSWDSACAGQCRRSQQGRFPFCKVKCPGPRALLGHLRGSRLTAYRNTPIWMTLQPCKWSNAFRKSRPNATLTSERVFEQAEGLIPAPK